MELHELVASARTRRRLPGPLERRLIREASGVKRAELAAAIGVAETTLLRWERGSNVPRADHIGRYVTALDELSRLCQDEPRRPTQPPSSPAPSVRVPEGTGR